MVAVGTNLALVLAPLKFDIFGTFVFYGQVPAIKLAYQILERYVQSAGIAVELAAVKIVVDGDKPYTIEGEND